MNVKIKVEVLLICPVRDEGERIVRLIDSLKSQTLLDWRVVIGDNASTDQTVAHVKQCSVGEPRVDLEMFEKSVHVSENFKRTRDLALSRYEPKYVGYVGGDDQYSEVEYLENLVEALKTGYSIAVPNFCLLDPDGIYCKNMPYPHFRRSKLFNRMMHSLNSNYGNIFYGLFRVEDFLRISSDPHADLTENLSSDWWFINTAFRVSNKPPKYVPSSTYFKYNKNISYSSNYYSGKEPIGTNKRPTWRKVPDSMKTSVWNLTRAKLILRNFFVVPTEIVFKEPNRISKSEVPEFCFLWVILVVSRFLYAISPSFFYGVCSHPAHRIVIDKE
jgi:glycosyltransferase involved in cell wall biosynthesis